MSASIAIQVLPEAPDDQELCRIVDEVIAYIAGSGLRYEVGPFETTIEGDSYDQLMDIVKQCQYVAVQAGAPKVSAYVKSSIARRGIFLPSTKNREISALLIFQAAGRGQALAKCSC